ncbi:YdaU family protein [Moraxella sp. ZY210820]|uniref:YdaU family protein n=1 Tax=Moraxella sp. ZY210820 TaxID=2904123 RepID=UPI002731B8DE|nr:YdaU family protein [Moraxella sp. ZY210820]WLF84812.1 YdaU family protein [Moraxella sp. ZY210820]
MNYYRFHIGDYYAHTAHLNIVEDCIYRRLIDVYYLSEKALTSDLDVLARRLRLTTDGEIQALKAVLGEFFNLQKGKYHHKRIRLEIKNFKNGTFDWRNDSNVTGENSNALDDESNGNSNADSNGKRNVTSNANSNAQRQAKLRLKRKMIDDLKALNLDNFDENQSFDDILKLHQQHFSNALDDESNGNSNADSNGKRNVTSNANSNAQRQAKLRLKRKMIDDLKALNLDNFDENQSFDDILKLHQQHFSNALDDESNGNSNADSNDSNEMRNSDNNVKNGARTNNHKPVTNKDNINKNILSAQAQEIFEFWKSVFGKNASTQFSDKRKAKVIARLKDGYSIDEIKKAIHNVSQNEFNVVNEYIDLELICRDVEHLERYRDLTPRKQAEMNFTGANHETRKSNSNHESPSEYQQRLHDELRAYGYDIGATNHTTNSSVIDGDYRDIC